MNIQIISSRSQDGSIVLTLRSEDGTDHELKLSVFDVSTLVSMLYATRAEALNQEPDAAPEVVLPLAGISLGQGDDTRQILRVYTTPVLYQDFSPEPGSGTESLIQSISDLLASKSDHKPVPWGAKSERH